MTITFGHDTATFTSTTNIDQQTLTRTVNFPGKVRTAQVVLQGFHLQYENGDHNVVVEAAGISNVTVSGTEVKFNAFIALRDQSHNPYTGTVYSIVIADLE